ncbi:MAG: glutaredoxin family protein [Candidatus ainarchaeum sp.]|nr:glutaredoxin family protein [Candidatus ainarchaeum sp.]
MAKKVIVYTAEWCPWCHCVTDFLKENKIAFESRNVDERKNAEEAMKKSGQAGIPVTDVDGQIVVGFDTAKLKELLKIK